MVFPNQKQTRIFFVWKAWRLASVSSNGGGVVKFPSCKTATHYYWTKLTSAASSLFHDVDHTTFIWYIMIHCYSSSLLFTLLAVMIFGSTVASDKMKKKVFNFFFFSDYWCYANWWWWNDQNLWLTKLITLFSSPLTTTYYYCTIKYNYYFIIHSWNDR